MKIPEYVIEKLEKLYANEFLGETELRILDEWLKQLPADQQFDQWLSLNWKSAVDVSVEISYDEIRRRIAVLEQQSKKQLMQQWGRRIQRVAAILLIPFLVLSIWMFIDRNTNSAPMVLATAKGEHSHVFLPDGSEVWLNVDSRLEYSTDFNLDNRNLKLIGEGFFKVAKQKVPFIVSASDFEVKAVGTEFNISAYDDGTLSSVYMKEGKIDLKYKNKEFDTKTYRMLAGDQAIINSKRKNVNIHSNIGDEELLWMKGELSFTNESLEEVFRKIERWYNVDLKFSSEEFVEETFTLHLKKDEPISKLFEIMDQAIGINIKQNETTYVISRK